MEGFRSLAARMAVALTMVTVCAPAGATTYNVSPSSDELSNGDQCSLREAIQAANTNATYNECAAGSSSEIDSIVLAAGNYPLQIAGAGENNNMTGDLDIFDQVTITGAGAATTTIDGGGLDRVIDVRIGLPITISGVTITGGHTPDAVSGAGTGPPADYGGGIWSAGALTLNGVVVTGNSTGNGAKGASGFQGGRGGYGGGIYAANGATLTNSVVSNNFTGAGGAGGDGNSGYGGLGGYGGGIASSTAVVVTDSTISGNHTGTGGASGAPGAANGGGAGAGGYGGGIYTSGALTITRSVIQGNYTGNGGDAVAGGTDPTNGGNGGSGGYGGGAMQLSTDPATITDSTFTGNYTGSGGQGGHGTTASGYSGSGGEGGGMVLEGGATTVTGSTFSGNYTGAGGNNAFGGAAGYGGNIGAFDVTINSTLLIENTTITGNTTGVGGATGTPAGGPGSTPGVSLYPLGGGELRQVTVAGNQPAPGGIGAGIIIYADVTLTNSVVASNLPENCATSGGATMIDGGHNVAFGDTTCPGVNGDPKLAALADNGGPTKTMALATGSAAIDLVPASGSSCTATDQRGTARPIGPACDAGAFEAPLPPADTSAPGPGPGPGGSPTPTPTTNPAALDLTPPLVKLLLTRQKLLRALRKGWICAFSTSEPGSALGELFFTGKLAAKRVRVARGTVVIKTAGNTRVVLKFTKKARKAFAKLRKVKLQLVLTVKDAAGNATKKTAKVVLKR